MSETMTLQKADFLREIERRSGGKVSRCLQCHKCSSGCPIAPEMDLLISQVMRLVLLGQASDVLKSETIWLCASCEACSTRCPMDIDIAAVMDTLRMVSIERGFARADARSRHFNKAFLTSLKWHGRVFEIGLMVLYKLRSLDLFSDIEKVPGMLSRRKLALFPHVSRMTSEVRKIFKNAEEEDKKR